MIDMAQHAARFHLMSECRLRLSARRPTFRDVTLAAVSDRRHQNVARVATLCNVVMAFGAAQHPMSRVSKLAMRQPAGRHLRRLDGPCPIARRFRNGMAQLAAPATLHDTGMILSDPLRLRHQFFQPLRLIHI